MHLAGGWAAPQVHTPENQHRGPPSEDQLEGHGKSKLLMKQHWKVPGEVEGFTVYRIRGYPLLVFCFLFLNPPFFFSFSFLFPVQLVFGNSALSKMTRRKTSPQKKDLETVLSPTELQNLNYNSMSESQFRSTI